MLILIKLNKKFLLQLFLLSSHTSFLPCCFLTLLSCFHWLYLCSFSTPCRKALLRLLLYFRPFSFVTLGEFSASLSLGGSPGCQSMTIDKLPSNGTKKKKKKSLLTEHNFGRQLCETTISLHFQTDSNGILKVDACRGTAHKEWTPDHKMTDHQERYFWADRLFGAPVTILDVYPFFWKALW